MKNEVSLKEYFSAQITDIKDNIRTAYISMEKRLDTMNEFRDTLKDQSSKFITRDEYDSKHTNLQGQIDGVQRAVWVGMGILLVVEFIIRIFFK
jgi:hypothetical protein